MASTRSCSANMGTSYGSSRDFIVMSGEVLRVPEITLASCGLTMQNGGMALSPMSDDDRLSRFAAAYLDVFSIDTDFGDGLTFCGAVPNESGLNFLDTRHVVSFSGAGTSSLAAFKSCVGEAVEYFSHVSAGRRTAFSPGPWRPTDIVALRHWIDTVSAQTPLTPRYVDVVDAVTGQTQQVPACLMLRTDCERSKGVEWLGWGNGCAAGATLEAAKTAALCEVIERDAIAMWWLGGRVARCIEATEVLSSASRDVFDVWNWPSRRSGFFQLLDISTDVCVPCVAAIAADATGENMVFGFGCHPDVEKACLSAMRELAQMEVGRLLLQQRAQMGGLSALNTWEKGLAQRLHSLNFHGCEPITGAIKDAAMLNDSAPADGTLAKRLFQAGFASCFLDLTDPMIGVPAAKVLLPVLQPYPCKYVSKRLQDQRAKAGIAEPNRGGWDIL
jgi:ribosomal protein S12 methylthiotransferase accessory factor